MNTLSLYKRFQKLPFGAWFFSKALCWRAPYFSSIRPRVLALRAGHCLIRVRKRRAVTNHIGTVHAIAMANACELAAGLAIDVSLPASHRWIPKGMAINYLSKAASSITALAEFSLPDSLADAVDVVIPVIVTDEQKNVVVSADITMYVTKRPRSDI